MAKRMLIDATHAEETRVVVLDGTRLEDFDVETSTKKQLKGNIYLAKVTRVEPSLQAAFVEYGGNRHGFLAFNEIHPDYYRIPIADREALLAEVSADGDAPREPRDNGGEDGEDHVETVGGDEFEEAAPRRHKNLRNYKIQEVVSRRQIMLVQVVKEERGNKGAALTTYMSLAGRYCVLMPNTPRGGGVSRKISSAADRKRLKTMLDDFEIPDGMAVIVRTAGMERPKTEIKRDYEYLMRLWDDIREQTLQSTAPALIHEEGDLIKRTIRDLYSRDIEEVLVEGEEAYKTAKSFMKMIMPSHAKKVQPYRDPAIPMLFRYQVESQLDAIHSPTVQLKSGGYIVINPTEALVSIDVNSGKATRERHIEETAVKTNLEAADEIARQLRLRDLAGLIVIDFIDMEENRNNHAVERRLKEAMKNDRARIQIGRISPFGLLELSRQRLRPSLIEASTEKCPHCAGTGLLRSTESTALFVLRGIEEEGIKGRSAEIAVFVPTPVALYILNQKRQALAEIEQRYGFSVIIDHDPTLIPPDFRLERLRQRDPSEVRPMVAAPIVPVIDEFDDVVEEEAEDIEEEAGEITVSTSSDTESDGGDGQRRKRRRGRRRKRRGDEGRIEEGSAAAGTDGASVSDSASESYEEGEEDGESEGAEAAEGATEDGTPHSAEGGDGEPRRRRRRGRRGGRRRNGRPEDNLNADGTPMTEAEIEAADNAEAEAEPAGNADVAEAPDASPVVETAPVEAPPVAEAAADEPITEEAVAPAPKKRAPRRKAATSVTVEEPVAEAAPVEAAPVEAEAPPAKPKRAPRRKAAAAEPAESVSEAVAKPAAEKPVAEKPAAAAPVEKPAAAPVDADAPKPAVAGVDVVVVDQTPTNPKKGWWRKLVS